MNSRFVIRTILCSFAVASLVALSSAEAQAACPKGTTIRVDNDRPGSGYRETRAKNWKSRPVNGCHQNYRYLSHTVGDGSRKGKAIWEPNITVTGWYRIVTGYRATENRTSDADYIVYDDKGNSTRTVVNQRSSSGSCERKDLGVHYCKAGGNCRLVLDGTDDSASDSADETTFELVRCSGGNPKMDAGMPGGRCDGIRKNAAYEVCSESSTTCAGVYTDGSGCQAFCQAAGMNCVKRFGGEPGCQKEPNYQIPCGKNNGHMSDWCVCQGPPLGTPDTGSDASSMQPDTAPSLDTVTNTPEDVASQTGDVPTSTDGAGTSSDVPGGGADSQGGATGADARGAFDDSTEPAGCACETTSDHPSPMGGLVAGLVLIGAFARSRRYRQP